MSDIKKFEEFSDAFSYCREVNAPVVTQIVDGCVYKLYPSGRADRVTDICPTCKAELGENIPLPQPGVCAGCGANWGPR